MDRQAVEVDRQHDHGEGDADAPEDVARDDSRNGEAIAGQHSRDDPARSGGDNGRHDGQKPRRRHRLVARLVRRHHLEGQAQTARDGYGGVEPPQSRGDVGRAAAPGGDAVRDEEVDQRGEAHGEGAEEEGLHRVADHKLPGRRVQDVAEDADGEDDGEDDDV